MSVTELSSVREATICRAFASLGEDREQNGSQNGDDRDHYEQLNQCESTSA